VHQNELLLQNLVSSYIKVNNEQPLRTPKQTLFRSDMLYKGLTCDEQGLFSHFVHQEELRLTSHHSFLSYL
jgi:hypothetical protein